MSEYAVNKQTGEVLKKDPAGGWQKVKSAKNAEGVILINEGGGWGPVPSKAQAPASPFLQRGMNMVSAAQASPVTGKEAALDARNEQIRTRQDLTGKARKAIEDVQNIERKRRVEPVERAAGEAGRAQLDQGPVTVNPNVYLGPGSEFMLPPDAQRGMQAEREVYRENDVTSSVDAATIRGINSILMGVPGILNKDFRGELAAAGEDQPGAAFGGDVGGFLLPSIGAWNTARTAVNALARPFIPQGSGAVARGTRYLTPRAGEVAGTAGLNAAFQAGVQEPIRAETAGEDLTLGGMGAAAARGLQDPLNLAPLALSGINRTWNALTSGIATPSARAAQMANQYGVGPRQTSASQGIAQTTQQLGGQLQGADIRGLTNIENALRFALRDNPNIRDVNARIADGFQRIRQSLPLEDDPTLNLARLIEREFANDAPQTRDIIRRFLSKVGQETPGGEAIVGGAANDIRGRQADVLEREAYSVFGSQPKDEAKKVLEGNKRTLGKQGYAAALDNLAPDAPGQEAALQRIATRDDAEGILFEAADAEGLTVEQYIQRNPLKSLHEIRASLAADARDLRAANNPDFDLERTVKSMDAVLEANVPNYKEIRKMYRSEATAFDRLGTTRDQRAGTEGELSYIPGFGDKLFGTPPMPSASGRAEGRATAKSVFDSMDEQSKKAAALSVRDVILDDLSKARAAGVDQRYEIAAKFQRLNSEGALKALVDVFGEGGQRIVNRIRQFVDANEFASAIDPMTGSNTMNKAQNLATGAQPFASGMGQRAQGMSNAVSESAIADSVLMLSGAPPIISAMRAPGIVGRMLQPGQRTQRNIAQTLLRRGEIGSQVPPPPGGPPPIMPIDPASVPGGGSAPPNALSGQPAPARPVAAGGFGGKKPPQTYSDRVAEEIRRAKPKRIERAATETDWQAALEDASYAMRRIPGREGDIASITMPDRDGLRIFAQEELAAAILKSRGIDPDPVYSKILSDRPTLAETDVFRKSAGYYSGQAKARERGEIDLEQMDDTDAAIEYMANLSNKPTTLNGLGLRTDASNALVGAGVGALGPAESPEERLRNMAIGAGVMGVGGRLSRTVGARNALAGETRTAGAGGPRKPKADSPEAIEAAVRKLATQKPAEKTRLERMVDERKDAAVPPLNPMPAEVDAIAAKAERLLKAGKPPLDIYDETRVVFIPYNGKNIPIVSEAAGPEEVIRMFYTWLREPAIKRPEWVNEAVRQSPRKSKLVLQQSDIIPGPPQPAPNQPLPPDGIPYGAIAGGALAGAATGIAGGASGILAYQTLQDRNRRPNALAPQ